MMAPIIDKNKRGKELNRAKVPQSLTLEKGASLLQRSSVSLLLVMIVGFFIYSNTFSVPFLFDDETSIYKSVTVKDTGYFTKAPVSEIITSSRPVGQLTFALNHAVDGLNVAGYHVVNLLIHLSCALLVYWLVVLIFRSPHVAGYFQGSVDPSFKVQGFVALFAALLFVSHPAQTQAVTYIVQRYASLATLFYLLSLFVQCAKIDMGIHIIRLNR